MSGAAIDPEARSQGRLVQVVSRAVQLRVQERVAPMIEDPITGDGYTDVDLVARDLAVALGTGETPVREAIEIGVAQGVLRYAPGNDRRYVRADPL